MTVLVHIALALLSAFVSGERRSKHAARGVARQARFYAGRHYVSAAGGVGDILPAGQLVWSLKRERIRAARFA